MHPTRLLVVLIASAAIFALACAQPPDTPEAAVEVFFEALSKGDQDRLLDSLCPANRGDFGGLEFVLNYFGLSTPPIGHRNLSMQTSMLDERTADVYTTGSLRLLFIEQPFEITFRTIEDGGRWYVCDEGISLGF